MDKTVIVTGASRGIGRCIAHRLCAQGARVVLAARGGEALQAALEGLPAARALPVQADVTSAPDVARLVAQTLAWSGRIDVLVNNAGVGSSQGVGEITLDTWKTMLDTNLTSVFLCSQAVLAPMQRQRQGHIVNMVSGAGRQGFPGWAAYCASKFGVVGFSQALREEVRAQGIRVSMLFPGSVDTPLWDSFPNGFDRTRMLGVDDVARAVVQMITQPPHVVVDDITLGYAPPAP